jgi:hypothetical protein
VVSQLFGCLAVRLFGNPLCLLSLQYQPKKFDAIMNTILSIFSLSLHSSSFKWRRVAAISLAIFGFGESKAQAALAGWDFDPLPGGPSNFGPSPLAPTDNDPNVTIGGLTRGGGIGTGGTGAANAWGGNDFVIVSPSQAAAVAANEFATFSVTPQAGFVLSISSIGAYNIRRSGTGPTSGIWQYDVGTGFTDIGSSITWGSTTTSAGNSQTSIDLSGISALQNVAAGSTVTFRVVTWGASNAGGTWYLNDPTGAPGDDFTLDGTVLTVVPEPVTGALMGFSAVFSVVQLGRFCRRHLSSR